MNRHFVHETGGRTCSRKISFDYIDGRIFNIVFEGGCRGNTRGVALLADGMTPSEIHRLLKGVPCQGNNSCPNELAMAMEELAEAEHKTVESL